MNAGGSSCSTCTSKGVEHGNLMARECGFTALPRLWGARHDGTQSRHLPEHAPEACLRQPGRDESPLLRALREGGPRRADLRGLRKGAELPVRTPAETKGKRRRWQPWENDEVARAAWAVHRAHATLPEVSRNLSRRLGGHSPTRAGAGGEECAG
jgi:hypothetical protein